MANEVQVQLSPLKGGRPPAVKAGGKRISKKQEIGILERHTKKTGLEKTRAKQRAMGWISVQMAQSLYALGKENSAFKKNAIANVAKIQTMDALNDTLEKLSHKFPAVVHMAHQKPRPALEKVTPLKRIYIIQQPRKC